MKPIALIAISAISALAAGLVSAEAAQRKAANTAPVAADEDGLDAQAAQRQRIEQQRMSWATFRHRQFAEGVIGNNTDTGYAWYQPYWRSRGIDVGMGGIGVDSDNYIYDPNFAGAYPANRSQRRGRSAVSSNASGGFGQFCTTPVKSCQLNSPSALGGGCSCKVSGDRSRGQVTP